MSTIEMRKLMENINLAESYDDRVNQVANHVNDLNYDEGGTLKKEMVAHITRAAEMYNVLEFRGSSSAKKDFIKDVAAKIKVRRDTSKADARKQATANKKARTEKVITRLAEIIQDEAGASFPDGDPIDNIIPKAIKMGIDPYDVGEWLDKAARKHLGVSEYNEYLAQLWNDQFRDAKGDYENAMQQPEEKRNHFVLDRMRSLGGPDATNPWGDYSDWRDRARTKDQW